MKRLFGTIALVCFIQTMALPAFANIDQQCLKLCIAGSGSSAVCLPKCSTPSTNGMSSANPATVDPTYVQNYLQGTQHNVLGAPTPFDGILLSPQNQANAAPGKDYQCFNACLNSGMQYDTCNRSCIKTKCDSTSVRCSDLALPTTSPANQYSNPTSQGLNQTQTSK